MKFFIKSFRLIGFTKNYDIEFKKGLNFISGPTSTGKSTILELINYALGSESHKSYIEVKEKCSDVEIEIIIKNTQFRIKRRLFSPSLPILVEIFDVQRKIYVKEGVYLHDSKEGKSTLSDFLLSKLGMDGITVVNQKYSFRDLFKYSYLKQTEIDNEDMFSADKNFVLNNKRKATFEVIFNIYDKMLSNLKLKLKEKDEELNSDKIKFDGVTEFLKTANANNESEVEARRKKINEEIYLLKSRLINIKSKSYNEDDSVYVNQLNKKVHELKVEMQNLIKQLNDQRQYIEKLNMLTIQYENEINKIDAARIGINEINKYDYLLCPNCLKSIEEHNTVNCKLCGKEMDDVLEKTVILKMQRSDIVRKRRELDNHIEQQYLKIIEINELIKNNQKELTENNRILSELTNQYINPYIEELSLINQRIGHDYKEVDELDKNLVFINELNRLTLLLTQKRIDVETLKSQIKSKEIIENKMEIIKSLSEEFNKILSNFKFPKLSNAYIDEKNYLPYVRGNKYNDIGSLGAVTLITMAYYLSILMKAISSEYNHLNILMIDTPRKNLGSSSTDVEFQDEEIYNSVIKYFIDVCENNENEIQIIIVNNGYPSFLPKEKLAIEFSSNGKTGLIDDI